ncbi:MAG TPA: hypothetical protein VFB51_14415 [Solirubrobacterales bacterium]|nr:hypothetical protein [Solirubrobacterales bacterium]
MAVYSCVPFFNEFHLLDLKIAEELDVVDRLVIAESDMTFQGARKPLHLKGNPKYRHPKIDLVLLEGRFDPGPWTEDVATLRRTTSGPWGNEALQRNALLRECEDDDVFIVADVDEINTREDIPLIVEQARAHGHVKLRQALYYYKLNLRVQAAGDAVYWNRALAVTGRYLRETGLSLHDVRRTQGNSLMPTRGKHFSYLADARGISEKIRSFAHAELNLSRFTDPAEIEARMRDHIDPFEREFELERVEIDDSYPTALLDDLEAWHDYIA